MCSTTSLGKNQLCAICTLNKSQNSTEFAKLTKATSGGAPEISSENAMSDAAKPSAENGTVGSNESPYPSDSTQKNRNSESSAANTYSAGRKNSNLAPTPTVGLAEASRIQQIELEKTKELNEKNVKLIREQMRKEEIASLQNSIKNDEKLLKEIEEQGTGADDYKYIESNLKKRRARLKEINEK